MNTLFDHIPTEMKKVASTGGGEYAGPCPWCGGEDRFRLWPQEGQSGRYWCRRCDWSGDGIDLLRELCGLTFAEACARLGLGHKVKAGGAVRQQLAQRPPKPKPSPFPLLLPPGPRWQKKARAFVEECRAALSADTGAARAARHYLSGRGLTEETIRAAGLGVNDKERRPLRTEWELPPRENQTGGGHVWLPRGIVLPWLVSGVLWKVNVRRPDGDVKRSGGPKYVQAAGMRKATQDAPGWSTNALYGADALRPEGIAVLVEGDFDALAVRQAAGDLSEEPLVCAVAAGTTTGARHPRWVRLLAACRLVLVAFDTDENGAGEEAARYWLRALPQARRWRPYWGDPAGMLEGGGDAGEGTALVREWVEAGLRACAGEDENEKTLRRRKAQPVGRRADPEKGAASRKEVSINRPLKKRADWAEDVYPQVEWLRGTGNTPEAVPAGFPSAGFALSPGRTVADPARFFRALRRDAAAGPEGPRARTGAVQEDLRLVFERFAPEGEAAAAEQRYG